jgi:hypothetical protein
MKEDATALVPATAAGTGAVVWNVKPEYCLCCSSFTPPSRPSFSGAVPIQLNGCEGNEPVVGDGNN